MTEIILASASPRRRELLSLAGIPFSVVTPDCDERSDEKDPARLVSALALMKGRAVLKNIPDTPILSADTVVFLNGTVLGKPKDEHDAFAMLGALSGATHAVYTGVCLLSKGEAFTRVVTSLVTFRQLSRAEIEAYIKTGEPMDKAGAYGIQGKGAALVHRLDGDFSNVMGLPVAATLSLMREAELI